MYVLFWAGKGMFIFWKKEKVGKKMWFKFKQCACIIGLSKK
jgi:hypothetical protein